MFGNAQIRTIYAYSAAALRSSIRAAGGQVLAEKLADKNSAVRGELLGFYAGLPRCVFQGDENFSNVLVDGSGHFTGLIDFNMSGTPQKNHRL